VSGEIARRASSCTHAETVDGAPVSGSGHWRDQNFIARPFETYPGRHTILAVPTGVNLHPEQRAWDVIDEKLVQAVDPDPTPSA
jgi:hypothetical protein